MHNLAAILSLPPDTGAKVIVSDAFNRADNASSLGTADTGQAWTNAQGTWGINTNAAYVATPNASLNVASVDAGVADCSIQVTLAANVISGGPSLAFRVSDSGNFLGVSYSAANVLHLFKFVLGSFSEITTGPGTRQDGQVIKVTVSGNSISVYENGVLVISASDSFNATVTKHGMGASGAESSATRWDNFLVTVP